MITGSQIAEYNGFKTCIGHDSVYGEQIQKICDIIESKDFIHGKKCLQSGRNRLTSILLEQFRFPRRVRVAMDCNGTASLIAPSLMEGVGLRCYQAFCDMDGTFPNHHRIPRWWRI
jgi:phosphomannomutase/phosphoglucomutase